MGAVCGKQYKIEDIYDRANLAYRKTWKHEKAYYRVIDPDGSPAFVEVHWFQCDGVPGRYREYVKRRDDEIYFYDINDWESRWKW